MRQPLPHPNRAWVEGHEAAMRKSAADAIAASNRWREINAEIMVKARSEGWDDYTITKAKAASMPLGDAYSSYSFFAGKAQMHAAVLQGALAARQLLADDDPTGLTYSREDDEPVAAPTRPHDGFTITGRNQRPTKQGEAGTRGLASPTISGSAR